MKRIKSTKSWILILILIILGFSNNVMTESDPDAYYYHNNHHHGANPKPDVDLDSDPCFAINWMNQWDRQSWEQSAMYQKLKENPELLEHFQDNNHGPSQSGYGSVGSMHSQGSGSAVQGQKQHFSGEFKMENIKSVEDLTDKIEEIFRQLAEEIMKGQHWDYNPGHGFGEDKKFEYVEATETDPAKCRLYLDNIRDLKIFIQKFLYARKLMQLQYDYDLDEFGDDGSKSVEDFQEELFEEIKKILDEEDRKKNEKKEETRRYWKCGIMGAVIFLIVFCCCCCCCKAKKGKCETD